MRAVRRRQRDDQQHEAAGGHRDAGPLARPDVEAEDPLGQHGEDHDAGREHRLHDRERRQRQRGDVEQPRAERDRHADREPLRAEQRLARPQRMADVDARRLVGAAVLVEETELCRDRAGEREQDAEVQAQVRVRWSCAAEPRLIASHPPRPRREPPGGSSPSSALGASPLRTERALRLSSTSIEGCTARQLLLVRRHGVRQCSAARARHLPRCHRPRTTVTRSAPRALSGRCRTPQPQHRHLRRPPQPQRQPGRAEPGRHVEVAAALDDVAGEEALAVLGRQRGPAQQRHVDLAAVEVAGDGQRDARRAPCGRSRGRAPRAAPAASSGGARAARRRGPGSGGACRRCPATQSPSRTSTASFSSTRTPASRSAQPIAGPRRAPVVVAEHGVRAGQPRELAPRRRARARGRRRAASSRGSRRAAGAGRRPARAPRRRSPRRAPASCAPCRRAGRRPARRAGRRARAASRAARAAPPGRRQAARLTPRGPVGQRAGGRAERGGGEPPARTGARGSPRAALRAATRRRAPDERAGQRRSRGSRAVRPR